MIDKVTTYDEYLDSDDMARKRQALSAVAEEEILLEDAEEE